MHFENEERMGCCARKNLFLTREFAGNEDAAMLYPVSSCTKRLAREVPVQVRRGLGSFREPLGGVETSRRLRRVAPGAREELIPLLCAAGCKPPQLLFPCSVLRETLRVLCFRRQPIFLGWSTAPPIPPAQGGASGSRWTNSPASPLHALSDPRG